MFLTWHMPDLGTSCVQWRSSEEPYVSRQCSCMASPEAREKSALVPIVWVRPPTRCLPVNCLAPRPRCKLPDHPRTGQPQAARMRRPSDPHHPPARLPVLHGPEPSVGDRDAAILAERHPSGPPIFPKGSPPTRMIGGRPAMNGNHAGLEGSDSPFLHACVTSLLRNSGGVRASVA